jgi:hypothetical protein
MAVAGSAIQYVYIELLDSSKRVIVKRCVYILDQAKEPALNFLDLDAYVILTPTLVTKTWYVVLLCARVDILCSKAVIVGCPAAFRTLGSMAAAKQTCAPG